MTRPILTCCLGGTLTLHHIGPASNRRSYWICSCGAVQPVPDARDTDGYYDPPLPLEAATDGQ